MPGGDGKLGETAINTEHAGWPVFRKAGKRTFEPESPFHRKKAKARR